MIDAVADDLRETGETFTEFKPTAKMQDALEYLRSKDYKSSVTQLCEAIGISRRAYYYWFDNPRFVNWWNEQCERHFALRRGAVYAALYEAATERVGRDDSRHNPSAIKLYLERFDEKYAPRSREDHTGKLSWAEILRIGDATAAQEQIDTSDAEEPKE